MQSKEHNEQVKLFNIINLQIVTYPEFDLLFAIPNGGSRGGNVMQRIINGRKLKMEGVKRGIPDLFLPVPRGSYHGLFIEMKVKPNGMTKEQKEWFVKLTNSGYKCVCCYSADEAFLTLCNYLQSNHAIDG